MTNNDHVRTENINEVVYNTRATRSPTPVPTTSAHTHTGYRLAFTSHPMPSLCTRITRLVTCTRAEYVAKATPPPPPLSPRSEPPTLRSGDLPHSHAITCVFEPRIDVLEKLVADLTQAVHEQRVEHSTQSAQTTRILQLLECLRAEHLAACGGPRPAATDERKQMEAEDEKAPSPVFVARPTLVLPPPPALRRDDAAQPITIPAVSSGRAAAARTEAASPAWYPVSSSPAADVLGAGVAAVSPGTSDDDDDEDVIHI